MKDVLNKKYKYTFLEFDCVERWNSLRNRFRKELTKQNKPSGSGGFNFKEWEFFQKLIFLKDHTTRR